MANLMGSNESIGSIQFGDLDLDFDLELDLDLNKEVDNKSVNVEVDTFGDALNDSANKTTGVDSTKDYIVNMIRGLNPEDDEVNMNEKIKYIKKQFCSLVQNKEQLFEMMAYINTKALIDKIVALKFGFLFSSELFDSLIVDGTNIRNVMLQILEKNYINSDIYRIYDRNRLYNSITLLGQYYHHVRLVYNTPIAILGISLLRLMTREVNGLDYINFELAKVIRAQ
ncbi:uncharacterized protein LOC119688262 [Teleopsis dalmanni]|uniref:uncharacterized protein LOC119688262 n=1 Tax=Teleopsis dalmanni TaxID=139649 RepID=UPI0018CE2F76|nr:uncharacterized protein LOC119688262 [Teleopsis dalmanni]